MKGIFKKIFALTALAATSFAAAFSACAQEDVGRAIDGDDSVGAIISAVSSLPEEGYGAKYSVSSADGGFSGRFAVDGGGRFSLEAEEDGVQTLYASDGSLFLNPEYAERGISVGSWVAAALAGGLSAVYGVKNGSLDGLLGAVVPAVSGVKYSSRAEISLTADDGLLSSLFSAVGFPPVYFGFGEARVKIYLKAKGGGYSFDGASLTADGGNFSASAEFTRYSPVTKSYAASEDLTECEAFSELEKIVGGQSAAFTFSNFGAAEGCGALVRGQTAESAVKAAFRVKTDFGADGGRNEAIALYDGGAEEGPAVTVRVNGAELSLTRGQCGGIPAALFGLYPSLAVAPAAAEIAGDIIPSGGVRLKYCGGAFSLAAGGTEITVKGGGGLRIEINGGEDGVIVASAGGGEYLSQIESALAVKDGVTVYSSADDPAQAAASFAFALADELDFSPLLDGKVFRAEVSGAIYGYRFDAEVFYGSGLPAYDNGKTEELSGNTLVVRLNSLEKDGERVLKSGGACVYYNGGYACAEVYGSPVVKVRTDTIAEDLPAFIDRISSALGYGRRSAAAVAAEYFEAAGWKISFSLVDKSEFSEGGTVNLFAPSAFYNASSKS